MNIFLFIECDFIFPYNFYGEDLAIYSKGNLIVLSIPKFKFKLKGEWTNICSCSEHTFWVFLFPNGSGGIWCARHQINKILAI